MFAGLVFASVLAGTPTTSPAPSPTPASVSTLRFDDARIALHLGIRGGGRFGGRPTGGGGGSGSLGLGVRLWRGLYLEASVGESVYANPNPEEPTSFRHLGPHEGDAALHGSALLVGHIVLGARYEIRTPKTSRVRPSVFLGASHLHEATLDDFQRAPGKTLAGTGDFILHRTGLQLGAGLRLPFPERWGPVAPRFSARIDGDFSCYFDGHPGWMQAGLGLGLQVVF